MRSLRSIFNPWGEAQELREHNRKLIEKVASLTNDKRALIGELYRLGEEAAKGTPIMSAYECDVQITESPIHSATMFRMRLNPANYIYLLPHRHAVGEESRRGFVDYFSGKIGEAFAVLLTDEWIKQGGLKKV